MSIDWKLLAEARGDAIVKLEKHLLEKKEWVGLTDEEVQAADDNSWSSDRKAWDTREFARVIEAKLKQKNGGGAASDTELRRLGYPL